MPPTRPPIDTRDEWAGLTDADVADARGIAGPNLLPGPERPSALHRLFRQLVHFFALMLWCAGGLAFLAGLPVLGGAIFLVIVLNAVFAFVQESRADRAAERLRMLLPATVTVRRDGRPAQVPAQDVVPGDVLLLGDGDRVPADARIGTAHGLLVDTSSFTGESEPTAVTEGEVFAGTFVVEGEAEALVTATGTATRLARIAELTVATPSPPSPLARELAGVVRRISVIAVTTGVVFFGISLLLGNPVSDGFVFAIGVTVALVPEALLPTVTLSLAWGAEQMSHRGVLVRELEAVETLGSTTFICTDKTGTLTMNQMTVVEAWTPAGTASADTPGYDPSAHVSIEDDSARPAVELTAYAAAVCSSGWVAEVDGAWRAHGDPTEAALDAFARRLGLDVDRRTGLRARFPFDPRRRRMSVVIDDAVFVKGAPDAVLPRCAEDSRAAAALESMTGRGLRVLAVAGRPVGDTVPDNPDDAERDLELYGLLAMEDPPRPAAADALAACRRAGMNVAMITGDHPVAARVIADHVGLRVGDSPVLVGDDLPDDLAALGAVVDRDGVVIARVSPEDKLRIAQALRRRGHTVAMTGDGVNDGPALHEADIGIAMGNSGTDVAREAADLVLLDDDFSTIVAGIEMGRATYLNVRRFLTYHLTDNVAELTPFVVWALSAGRIPLALTVLQVLALDIGTDTFSAVALGAEPPAPDTLGRPPVSGALLNRTVARRSFGLLGPTVAVLTMTAFFATFLAEGWRPGGAFSPSLLPAASGAAFMTVVLAQSANAFASRSSNRSPFTMGWTSNRLLPGAVLIELGISLMALLVPPVASALDHEPPGLVGWAVAVAAPGVVLAVDAVDKGIRAHRRR